MSWRVDRAAELKAEAEALITASTLTDKGLVVVTHDARDIDRAPNLNAGVVVILPGPRLAWPVPTIEVATWQIDILAGPVDNVIAAWERLDALLEVLRPMFLIGDATAIPGSHKRADETSVAGYTVTFPEHYQD